MEKNQSLQFNNLIDSLCWLIFFNMTGQRDAQIVDNTFFLGVFASVSLEGIRI
jgi:hypothetical protein